MIDHGLDTVNNVISFQSIHGIISWRMTTWDDSSNSPNKAGEAYINLYHKEWRTNEITAASATGTVELRGFLGDYTITILENEMSLGDFQFSLDANVSIDCIKDIILNKIECSIMKTE